MDLRQLKYLDEIIKHKTISRAANALYISQPALTMSIAKLEDEVGFKIIQKGDQGYILTDAGVRFYNHVKFILASMHNLEEDIHFIQTQGAGRLKIGITEEFRAVIPELFEIFLSKNDKYDIKLTEDTTGQIVNQLRMNEIHFCLTTLNYLDEDMVSTKLSDNPYALLVRATDVERYKKKRSLSELKQFNLIYTEDTYDLEKLVKTNDIKYKNLLQVNTIGAAVRLVKKGLGIALIPELYAKNYTDAEVKSVKLKVDLYGPDLYLSYMKRQYLPPAVVEFMRDIEEYVRKIKERNI